MVRTVNLPAGSSPAADDHHTIARARRGDREACRQLFRRHFPAVRAYCITRSGDVDRGEDWAQDAFVRAFRYLDSLQDPSRFAGWVMRIAVNVCRAQGKKAARHREMEALMALEPPIAPEPPEAREARGRAVATLIAEISDPQLRRIVELRYREPEHTAKQIAEKLNIPLGTVGVKLMRFRTRVKRDVLLRLIEEESP